MQSVKRKRRCENQCQQHIFSLMNDNKNTKYDVCMAFCPKYQRQPLPPQQTHPVFNNDFLYYTSAFVLGVDMRAVAKNLQGEMLEHQKLIKQSCEKYNQIVFPRPNSKHTTCSVCKEQYTNYYNHIFSWEHRQKIRASPYNKHIHGLCNLFKHFWEGCAEKADEMAFAGDSQKSSYNEQVEQDLLELEDILQQEEINQPPSRIQDFEKKPQVVKQSKPHSSKKIPKLILPPLVSKKPSQDREARKKSINFAAYFEDEPSKKRINDHREPVTVSHKKQSSSKPSHQPKPKKQSKQFIVKKQPDQTLDPFIIEYNARKKQKKSYYYIMKEKKKLAAEKAKEQEQKMLGEQKEKNHNNRQQNNDQIQNSSYQGENSQYDDSYQKYVDQFHQEKDQKGPGTDSIKKTYSKEFSLFEQVEKKPLSNNNLFQTFKQKQHNPFLMAKYTEPKSTDPYLNQSVTRPLEVRYQVNNHDMQSCITKKQDQQQNNYIDKDLPMVHRFKNFTKDDTKSRKYQKQPWQQIENQPFTHRLQKIHDYYRDQKNIMDLKSRKDQQYEDKNSSENIPRNSWRSQKYDKTAQYHYADKISRHPYPSQHFRSTNQKKTKEGENGRQKSPIRGKTIPYSPYPGPSYPPYYYTEPNNAYPGGPQGRQRPQKIPASRYQLAREHGTYEKDYMYPSWQHPYYPPHPSLGVPHPYSGQTQDPYKAGQGSSHQKKGYNSSGKSRQSDNYEGYPYYPGPGVVGNPREYPSSSVRLTHPPSTSININFPMYMGYHPQYPYPTTQRYPPHVTPGHSSGGPGGNPYAGSYNSSAYDGSGKLQTYAEYLQYRKRENEKKEDHR